MSDIYGFAQPVTTNEFRLRTESHKSMAGVTYATFTCVKCKQPKHTEGSRWVDASRKHGRYCAPCAPAVVEAPPVASKAPRRASVSTKPEKPPKAQKMTDAQVLECREAHEFEGVRPEVLVRKYGVTPAYMRQVLDYAVRSKLIPERYRK